MQHHLSGGITSTREGTIPFLESASRHFGTARRFCIYLIGVTILLLPLVVSLGLVLLFKPDGELSRESNTIYWLAGSVFVAISALSGVALVAFLLRRIASRIYSRVYDSVPTTEPEMHDEFIRRVSEYDAKQSLQS